MAVLFRTNTELAVLSTCLNNLHQSWVSHTARVGGPNPETLFYDSKNAATFAVLNDIVSHGKTPSLALVEDELGNRHASLFEEGDILGFLRKVLLVAPLDHYGMETALDDLKEARQQRHLQREIEVLTQDIGDDEVDVTSSDVARRLKEIIDSTEITQDLQTFGEMTQEILDSPAPMWTQSTGIDSLDDVLGGSGFESGTLTVVAARPKVGKTVFMNSMIYVTLDSGNYPLVFNYETKKVEFLAKMISRHICDPEINWGKIKAYISGSEDHFLRPAQVRKVEGGIEWALKQDWYLIFDKTTTAEAMEAIVTRVKSEVPEDRQVVVFVDYLQLLVTDNMNAVAQISDWTRFFKLLATTYDVAVVLLTQLNRQAGDEKPRVHQMRGSGSIEQDADVVLLLDDPNRRKKSVKDEDGNVSEQPDVKPNTLEIDANTSRLATGGDMELFIDGGIQFIDEKTEENTAPDPDDFLEFQ